MKGLSIEEKAKRYDEAIERVNELNYVSDKDSLQRKTVEYIFPELREESEDEKIKKWLIELVEEVRKTNPTNVEHNGMCSEALDWIEKQVEHTNFRNKIQIGDQVTRNKDGVLVNLSQLKRVAKPAVDIEIPFGAKDSELIEECIHIPEGYHAFIKGDKIIITKKENPNEWKQDNIEDLTDFENAMMHIGGSFFGEHAGLNPNDTSSIKEQANILLGLVPRQEWSEEDEVAVKDICDKLNRLSMSYVGNERIVCQEEIKWLKSLRPQPKQEWSQKDIDMIDWFIRCCEKEHEELCNDKYGHQDIVSDLKRDCRKKWDWLESLKNKVAPQNQWKPSDEQMEALWKVYKGGEEQATLASLYSDLKKLKRE